MALIDLSMTLKRLSIGSFTVTRFPAGSYVGGRWTPATPSTFQLSASIYGIKGRKLLRLPEGLRTSELIEIFSLVQVLVADPAAGTDADQVTFNGKQFEVEISEDKSGQGNFFYAVARKKGK